MVDNAEWLLPLNYVEFLRDIGRHFSVNGMLAAEAYKTRLEKGLSFIEFNYQLLQAYDFLVLFRRHGCTLQIGGDDQWGNILAGADLIRRLEQQEAFALTFPLLMTASGEKMGKTAAGAVWLDAERTSPFDFYQYFVNVDDRDVGRFLKLFTFLPMEEIAAALGAGGGGAARGQAGAGVRGRPGSCTVRRRPSRPSGRPGRPSAEVRTAAGRTCPRMRSRARSWRPG